MKIKKILPVVTGCLVAMLSSNTFASIDISDFYVGLDVLKTSYSLQENYGRNVFAKNPMAYNVFVGYQLPRDFFVEIGHERTRTKKASNRLESDYDFGVDLPPIWMNLDTKLQNNFTYMGGGISYYLPKVPNTYLSVLLGVAVTKFKGQFVDIGNEINPAPTQDQIDSSKRTFIKNKVSPFVKLGVNHEFSKHVGIRFTTTWHKLGNFKIKCEQSDRSDLEIRLQNSYSIGLGVFYYF